MALIKNLYIITTKTLIAKNLNETNEEEEKKTKQKETMWEIRNLSTQIN